MNRPTLRQGGFRGPLVGCAILLALLIGIGGWLWWVGEREAQRGWTKEMLENRIQQEIGPGSDRGQVERWFEKHRIEHWYAADTTQDRAGSQTMPEIAGLRDAELSGMVRGWIDGPDANVGGGSNGRITIYFFLDKQGRVVGHLVHPFVYSL